METVVASMTRKRVKELGKGQAHLEPLDQEARRLAAIRSIGKLIEEIKDLHHKFLNKREALKVQLNTLKGQESYTLGRLREQEELIKVLSAEAKKLEKKTQKKPGFFASLFQ